MQLFLHAHCPIIQSAEYFIALKLINCFQVDDKEHCFDGTLVKNILHESDVYNAAWLCCAFAMLFFGSGVCVIGHAYLLQYILFFKAMFLGFNYTGGYQFKQNCLGEFIVFITFGPTIATFTYSCLTKGSFSLLVLLASTPFGIAAASLVFANNIRDSGIL